MSLAVKVNPRALLMATLLQVKYVKVFEELLGIQDLLRKKFGDKVDFWYCDEQNFRTMIWRQAPFAMTKDNPGASGYSIITHPDYSQEREIDLNFWLRHEVVEERERKFFLKEFAQTVREYYESIPGGKERLWEVQRKNTPEQIKKLGG